MYNRFQLAQKYLRYYLTASNGKGHGIHSPFVFDFVKNVLNDKKKYECYSAVEKVRQQLLKNEDLIEVEDMGAGSGIISSRQRKISEIARSSVKSRKFSQLLFRMAKYYKPGTIIELGTSLGITTSYFACARNNARILSLEGSENIAAIAQRNFKQLGYNNIEVVKGNFDDKLQEALGKIQSADLAFIDGNHRKDPTLRYFSQLSAKCHDNSIMIFDDIHWSTEMEEVWNEIREDGSVTLSIDLFFIGIIFFKKDFKAKQHFIIRF